MRDVKSVVLCVVARLMHLTLQGPEDCLVGASSPFRVLPRAGRAASVPRFLNASWVVIGNKGRIPTDIDVWPAPIADHALSPLAGNLLIGFSDFSCPFLAVYDWRRLPHVFDARIAVWCRASSWEAGGVEGP